MCIIGSGPAGTILGTSLAKRGVRTIILESGGGLARWLMDSRIRRLASYEYTGDTDYPLTKTRGKLLGGTSNFWTGRCERFHPSDMEKHPYSPGGRGWPVSYAELDPYYEQAESTLRVRGDAGSSRHGPPRRTPLPLPPKPDISYLKNLLARIGLEVNSSPTATPTRGLRFFRVQKEILPDYLKAVTGTLICGATVTRLLADKDRRIVGAEVRSLGGGTRVARAKFYVVAGGGIETPRLLLHSRSDAFPKGIGNAHEQVGLGFNEHPGINFYGKIRHAWGTVLPTNKIGRSHQYYDRFRAEGLGSVLLVFRQAWVFPHHTMPWKLANIPRNLLSVAGRTVHPTLYIGATTEMRITESNRVMLSERMKDAFGNPLAHLRFRFSEDDRRTLDRARDLILEIFHKLGARGVREAELCWSRHHQGTCRMGDDPKASVTDRNLRVHETPNLYLCGAEVFPTGGAMQPLLTIAALAHRLSDHLAARLRQA